MNDIIDQVTVWQGKCNKASDSIKFLLCQNCCPIHIVICKMYSAKLLPDLRYIKKIISS